MSIKLKDTIYDLVNKSTTSTKATQDGSGNVIVDTYLKKTGDYMSGDLNMMNSNQHNSDQFIRFKYSTTDLDGFSWRIGYIGSGDSNENRLVIQNNSNGSGGSSTSWGNVLTFGLFDKTAIFTNTPKVGSTNVSLEGHTHSQYLTSLPSHNHNGSYLSLSNTQTPVVTNSQQGIVNFKSTDTSQAGIRIFQGDTNKGGLWWISGYGMVIYSNSPSNGAYLGILDNGTPHFNKNTLLHAGNYTSYCATSGHTHNYAGSSYSGGAATSADKLNSIELSSGSLGSYYTEVNNYYAGGSNAVTDKPSGVDAFGVLNLRTAQGWWGQVMISSNLATGMYWRTGTSLSGGWRTIIDTSNYTTWCATSGHTHSGYAASNHTHSNYSTTDHTHSNYYDYNVSRTANTILAAPNGAAGSASFRKLVSADLPSHNHSAANITSETLAVARGGTGQTTLNAACWDLLHSLTGATATPYDSSYYITQDIDSSIKGYYKRTHLALYNYVKGKLDSVYAPSSHSHSYLPLGGGTISANFYGPLTIYRNDSANMAAIKFQNTLGALGSIGMNAVSGDLIKYNASISSYVIMLDSGNYTSYCAKASHSHSYLPLSGGNLSGHLYLTGANAGSSTANTSQIVFGTSSNNHVCISSNNNVLVINPTISSTTNQIALYLDSASQFPSGINVGSLQIGGQTITFTT